MYFLDAAPVKNVHDAQRETEPLSSKISALHLEEERERETNYKCIGVSHSPIFSYGMKAMGVMKVDIKQLITRIFYEISPNMINTRHIIIYAL